MNDTPRMRFRQRFADLYSHVDNFIGRHRRLDQPGRERLTLDVLHDDEDRVAVLVDFINCADVRMIEGRCRPSFAKQTLARVSIIDRFGR